jgi:hypothetical protein
MLVETGTACQISRADPDLYDVSPHTGHSYAKQQLAALRRRAEEAERALVKIGHELLGCDGYPCRVEKQAAVYVEDMLGSIRDMARALEKASIARAARKEARDG